MRKTIFAIFAMVLMSASVFAVPNRVTAMDTKPLQTVSSVDLKRYAGMWYEIARYPNKFERDCAGNVTATYTIKPDGNLEVINKCLKKDGKTYDTMGDGRIVDKTSNAKFKVRFAPGYLSFFPKTWSDYWIIDLASDYSYAVVGDPKRDYLWILSRTPKMDDATYQAILRRAEAKGFNPAKLDKTDQNVSTLKGTVMQKQ